MAEAVGALESGGEEERSEERHSASLAIVVWARGRVVRRQVPPPPYKLKIASRLCGEAAAQVLAKAVELGRFETGFRVLAVWVPRDAFTGRVYYLVPYKTTGKDKKRCIKAFESLDEAIAYALRPRRGLEPA